MSEWLDLQQNKHDSLRLHEKATLDEQIAAALEEDALDTDEKKRLAKLGMICAELRRGKNVQNRQLQRWLTADEYEQFEQEWLGQKERRAELEAKPEALCKYEQQLKRAIFFDNRAEGYSTRGKAVLAKRFRNRADVLFERALEHLGEVLAADPALNMWLDRTLCVEAGAHSTGIDSESVPRVVTSRSHNKSGGDVRQMSKLEVKLMVVESAINSILAAVKDDEMKAVSRKQTLDEFLKNLEERD